MVLSPPCSQHQAVTTLTVRCLQQRMSCTSTKNMPTKFSLKTGTNEFFYLTSFHYMSCKSITLPLHKILNENLIERGNIDANKGGVGGMHRGPFGQTRRGFLSSGPKYKPRGLQRLLDQYFESNPHLDRALTSIIIPTFDTKIQQPVIFSSWKVCTK